MSSSSETDSRLVDGSRNPSVDSAPTDISETKNSKLLARNLLASTLSGLYSESASAKIWSVAVELLEDGVAPANYPEWAPEDGETPGKYNTKEVNFWTCGFFPGSLFCLLERCVKYPKLLPSPEGVDRKTFHKELLRLCKAWAAPMHLMSHRTNTHDMGFITQPALRQDWELNGSYESLDSVVRAAENLASRYVDGMRAVRSWDKSISKRYDIHDKDANFLVIVDSMCSKCLSLKTRPTAAILTNRDRPRSALLRRPPHIQPATNRHRYPPCPFCQEQSHPKRQLDMARGQL